MKAANTSKKKRPCTGGGQTLLFCCNWRGQARELGGQLPLSLYIKRGSGVLVAFAFFLSFRLLLVVMLFDSIYIKYAYSYIQAHKQGRK